MVMKARDEKMMLTIKEQVYSIIKENILSEHFKPGERINEVQIANDLKVSRSPVRSAINELIGEGLLESVPNKFVKVRQLTEKEILDIYEFRVIVEKYAIEKVIALLDDTILAVLRDFRQQFINCCTYEQLPQYVEVDSRFHNYLVESSGNQVVLETLHRVGVLVTPFRVISLKSRERFQQSIEEHTGMIDAICEKDLARAWERCQSHLSLAKQEIVAHLRAQPTMQ
jgi:DNA-binding GntR family transcriptional regulator